MKALQILFPPVAFVLAVIGVLKKDTVDASKEGISRITKPGWIVLALAFVTFVPSLLIEIDSYIKEKTQTQENERVVRLAHTEVRLALMDLTEPFRLAYHAVGTGEKSHSYLFSGFHLLPEGLSMIDDKVQEQLGTINLDQKCSYACGGERWTQVFSTRTKTSMEKVQKVLDTSSDRLNADIRMKLSKLRSNGFLGSLINLTKVRARLGPRFEDVINPADEYGSPYVDFWKLVDSLDKALIIDEAMLIERGITSPQEAAFWDAKSGE